ncbi:glucosaminidase domain-containing protein [Paenibacillus polysaccharolyticus]|uniref:glucosaminidase domain-containing protein n=1 Tax=Paenibacillus polysaccharolyticus TaxID=582692 RepID=UPI0030094706
MFESAGKKYGIDPALLAAIAMHETGNGTSKAVKNKNNVGGMMGKNGLMTFGSIEEGIDKMASNLKRLYFDQGLTTIPQIQKKYAPVGASNDPTGLNNNWVSGVTRFYQSLGG